MAKVQLFLVSLHISSLFCCFALCKDEFRVEILVKGYGCGEWFALLAGETIERSGLALGKRPGDPAVESLACTPCVSRAQQGDLFTAGTEFS